MMLGHIKIYHASFTMVSQEHSRPKLHDLTDSLTGSAKLSFGPSNHKSLALSSSTADLAQGPFNMLSTKTSNIATNTHSTSRDYCIGLLDRLHKSHLTNQSGARKRMTSS